MHRLSIWVGGAALAASAASAAAAALTQAAAPVVAAGSPGSASPPSLAVHHLSGRAYWLSGGPSNSGFVIGNTGVVAIDAQMVVPMAQAALRDIAALTSLPVNAVILTHSDPDHINGVPGYPAGLRIIAQANARRDIARVIVDPVSNGTPPPPQIRDYVPTETVDGARRIVVEGVRMVLIHTAPAHTDGDLAVYLPDERLVYAGDLLTPAVGPYPGIHLEKHGTSLGWIASVRKLLTLKADLFIGGHGDQLTKPQVEKRVADAEQRRRLIATLAAQGKSLNAIEAQLHDAPPAGFAARFPSFTETTYQEVTHLQPR